jgi:23S rRNA pseudouridine2605 synthase
VDRVTYGPLTKKDLPRGHWRFLTDAELNLLRMTT